MENVIGTWDLNGNGFLGKLEIPNVDADGNLVGAKAYGLDIIGFWGKDAQKITFLRSTSKVPDHRGVQVFTGYFILAKPDLDHEGTYQDTYYLAGSFEAFQGTGGRANQALFGWFARRPGKKIKA